jgi:hypothetical protein
VVEERTMTRGEIIRGLRTTGDPAERRAANRWLLANAVISTLLAGGLIAMAVGSAMQASSPSQVASAIVAAPAPAGAE